MELYIIIGVLKGLGEVIVLQVLEKGYEVYVLFRMKVDVFYEKLMQY